MFSKVSVYILSVTYELMAKNVSFIFGISDNILYRCNQLWISLFYYYSVVTERICILNNVDN